MIIKMVQYTVEATYTAQNQEYIRRYIQDLRDLRRTDFIYNVFVKDDGKTFFHLSVFANEEARSVLDSLQGFKTFQAALSEGHLEVPPGVTDLTLVGSTDDMLS